MTTQYATSYDQTTTVTQYSTTQTTSSGVIDKLYIRSIPGILKLVEMVWYACRSSLLTVGVIFMSNGIYCRDP